MPVRGAGAAASDARTGRSSRINLPGVINMGAREEIESFLAELAGNPTTAGQVAPLLQWLHNSDDLAAIQFCDAVCAVIRRKELSVRERANELRPILIRLLDLLESRH